MQKELRSPGNPSGLSQGENHKKIARDKITVANITSFSSRPLKLEDFIE